MKHYKRGDYPLALTFFRTAEGLDADATDADVYIKKISDASDAAKDSITPSDHKESERTQIPNDIEKYYYLGVTAAKNNEGTRAKRYFEKTIALDTNHRKAYIGLGNLYLADEERIKAIAYFESAYALDKTDLKVTTKLMETYKDLGAEHKKTYTLFKKKVDSLKMVSDN